MIPQQTFTEVFGVSPVALVAYALLHLHLFRIGRRLARVESTPTVAHELPVERTHSKH